MLKMKRIYEPAAPDDGYRILVDRIWPRGVSKEAAHLDLWAKDITPTTEIRKEFGHLPERFDWFRQQYLDELSRNPAMDGFIDTVRAQLTKGNVTFVYAAKDPAINHVVILKAFVEERL